VCNPPTGCGASTCSSPCEDAIAAQKTFEK
jgi:hypothetical protein